MRQSVREELIFTMLPNLSSIVPYIYIYLKNEGMLPKEKLKSDQREDKLVKDSITCFFNS